MGNKRTQEPPTLSVRELSKATTPRALKESAERVDASQKETMSNLDCQGFASRAQKRNRRDALERQGEALGWPFIYSVMLEKPSTRPVVASHLAYARSDADLCTRETHPSPSTWAPSGPAACKGCQCATERRHPKPMPNWVSLGPIKRRIQRAEL